MKQKAKKALAANKVEMCRTGGGVFTSQVDATDEKVLAVLGNRATPLVNCFDSDATYNLDSSTYLFVNEMPSA